MTDVFVVEVRFDFTGQWLYTQVQTSFFFHNFFLRAYGFEEALFSHLWLDFQIIIKSFALIGSFIIAFGLNVQFAHDKTALEKGSRIWMESIVKLFLFVSLLLHCLSGNVDRSLLVWSTLLLFGLLLNMAVCKCES